MNQKGSAFLGIIIGFLVVLSISGFIGYKYLYKPQTLTTYPTSVPEFTKETAVDISPSSAPLVVDSLAGKYWQIKKNGKLFYSLSTDYGLDVAKWGDWLITTGKAPDNKSEIFGININTDQGKSIFKDPDNQGNTLHSLTMINNKLYFASSGYLTDGGVYMLESLDSAPQKISSISGAHIGKTNDNYFITGNFGDSCSHSSDINLLNPSTNSVTPIIKTYYGCGKGTMSIGYNAEKGFLIASSEYREGTEGPDGWITELIAHPISGQPQVLISKEAMPFHVSNMKYDPLLDTILFITEDALYTFNPKSSVREKIMDLQSHELLISQSNESTICVQNFNNGDMSQISLSEKKLVPITDFCDKKFYNTNRFNEAQDKFKSLNLPKEFTLSVE